MRTAAKRPWSDTETPTKTASVPTPAAASSPVVSFQGRDIRPLGPGEPSSEARRASSIHRWASTRTTSWLSTRAAISTTAATHRNETGGSNPPWVRKTVSSRAVKMAIRLPMAT